MNRRTISVAFVVAAGVLVNIAQSAIVQIDIYTPSYQSGEIMWGFDNELQQLTIIEKVIPGSLGHSIDVLGSVDSEDSLLSVTRIITNYTGVSWTGISFFYEPHRRINISDDWMELTELTALQTIVSQDAYGFEATEPERLLDGETFTIQFDVHVHPDDFIGRPEFYDSCRYSFTLIPEPATISLLGLGGLALLRNRRRVRS